MLGLPKDEVSTENAILIDMSVKTTLLIDPQSQASKFIKNLGKEHEEGIDLMKASDNSLMRTIEIGV
jgi:dynein heavy chain